ncbi:LAETG motif-containing sortase-dependent surface protein [Kitasatospora sp. NPDC101183]|uniref:LAETG motif-containing sortase-dependent surface protein n=1 Tax=Kitasatospora sp. NPDC101183 TaxID=3364100 RepID=UPI003821D2C5
MARQQRTFRMGAAALAGTAAAVFALPLALATNASAHTPSWSVTCDKVQIDLINYSGNETVKNTVSLTIDGEKVLDGKIFPKEFHGSFPVKDHNAPITAHLVVKTTETPNEQGWNIDESKTIAPCHTQTPTPTPTTPSQTPSQTPTPTPTTASPSASKTPTHTPSPSPSTAGPVLAQTGGSSNTPIIAAAGAGVLVVGGALVMVARKRRGGAES